MEAILGYGSSDDDQRNADHVAATGDVEAAAMTAIAEPGLLPPAVEVLGGSRDKRRRPAELDHDRHGGRVRSFPHVEGNYATHVYISVEVPPSCRPPLEALLCHIHRRVSGLQPVVESHGEGGGAAGAQTPPLPAAAAAAAGPPAAGLAQASYHLSLSRTSPARLSQIDSLTCALRQQLRKVDTLTIRLGRPEVLTNDERTRTFLALSASAVPAAGVVAGADPLLRAMDATSAAFQRHGLPRFYEDPRPHVSVAWVLGDRESELRAALAEGEGQRRAEELRRSEWACAPRSILCRTGRKQYVVWSSSV